MRTLRHVLQYYDDEIYGFVQFVDKLQNVHGLKAQRTHIRLVSYVRKEDRYAMRKAIADDINGGMDR